MRRDPRSFVLASVFALTAACGGSTSTPSSSTPHDGGATNGDDGGGASAGFKTHVILGDSISDQGGQGPFFYDLLDKDLKTKYGDDIKIVKASKGGATATGLVSQAKGLPTSLTGPVLVTITIGGNDVVAAMGSLILSGNDNTELANFKTYLDGAFTELTKPGRFGDGVTAKILITNIYDPSDGTGTFKFANGTSCGQPFSYWNKGRTDMYLSPWQDVMKTTAANYPGITVLDLHARFMGHGVPATDTWFVSDCIHPNSTGHENVRALFWDAISAL